MSHMPPATIQERILEALRRSARPLDDDELAQRLSVSPRQTINQACRRLQQAGRLKRFHGADGKLVNTVVQSNDRTDSSAHPAILATTPAPLAPGDSREQRQAERFILEELSDQLDVALSPRRITFDSGARVEVDGADEELSVLAEIWAHQGSPKSAQKHKVLADTLKLLYVASTLPTTPRLVLCFADEEAARHFTTSRSWAALALRDFGVEVRTVQLPKQIRAAIKIAQERQFR
jgi:hypothetical protein